MTARMMPERDYPPLVANNRLLIFALRSDHVPREAVPVKLT
jgi:hypothetical protein